MSLSVRVGPPVVPAKTCHWCGAHGEWAGPFCPLCNNTDPRTGMTRRERLIGRNRQLRALLVDVLGYLERADTSDLVRRARLAQRVREAVAE